MSQKRHLEPEDPKSRSEVNSPEEKRRRFDFKKYVLFFFVNFFWIGILLNE